MEPNLEAAEAPPRRQRSRRTRAMIGFAALWLLLAAGGLTGAAYYLEQMKADWTRQIGEQTAAQIAESEARQLERLQTLETDAQQQLDKLAEQVQSINELLAFIKDHSSDKSDDSNQLYSQLNEIQAQLDQLKKNLDVLQ